MCIGIEIGGTFTDPILLRDGSEPVTLKVSSTPPDPSEGALFGGGKLLEKASPRGGLSAAGPAASNSGFA